MKAVPIDQTDRNDVLGTIRDVFTQNGAYMREEAIRAIADALGYRRLGPRITEILVNDLQTAVRRGILKNTRGEYSLLCSSIDDYEQDHLVKMLLSAMGTAWQTRQEAIVATTRHLGFRRTGNVIKQAIKSTISTAVRRGQIERNSAGQIRRAR